MRLFLAHLLGQLGLRLMEMAAALSPETIRLTHHDYPTKEQMLSALQTPSDRFHWPNESHAGSDTV